MAAFMTGRALSLREPWLTLMLRGCDGQPEAKNIENRLWRNQHMVGQPILLHAAKSRHKQDILDAMAFCQHIGKPFDIDLATIQRGGIAGIAVFDEVRLPGRPDPDYPWHMEGQFGYRVKHIARLPFTPCDGALGLFLPSWAILRSLRDAIVTTVTPWGFGVPSFEDPPEKGSGEEPTEPKPPKAQLGLF